MRLFLAVFLPALLVTPMAQTAPTDRQAQQAPISTSPAEYVSVNIEIHELAQAGELLHEATEKLSNTLELLAEHSNELSPEQIQELATLTTNIESLALSLDTSLRALPETLTSMRPKLLSIIEEASRLARQQTLDPIQDKMDQWVIYTLCALVLIALLLFTGLALGLRALNQMRLSIQELAEGYRVVPVEQYRAELARLQEHDP